MRLLIDHLADGCIVQAECVPDFHQRIGVFEMGKPYQLVSLASTLILDILEQGAQASAPTHLDRTPFCQLFAIQDRLHLIKKLG